MKTAVSLPDDLYERAERAAERLGLNRSQLYSEALAKFLLDLGPDPVTERLSQLAGEHAAEQTPAQAAIAARSLIDSGGWRW